MPKSRSHARKGKTQSVRTGQKSVAATKKGATGSARSNSKQAAVIAMLSQRRNDPGNHEGDRLAAALGARVLCRRRAQEARVDA
jgi:hypothetical protein